MDARHYVRRLSAALSSSHPSPVVGQTSDAAESTCEAHQRVLARRAARGAAPPWTEEPETCDVCGRHLMAGERADLYHCGEELAVVCPLCALEPSFAGFRVAASAGQQEPGSRHQSHAA